MRPPLPLLFSLLLCAALARAFPGYILQNGRSQHELDSHIPTPPDIKFPPRPPGPLEFGGAKLVHDEGHPWRAPRKGDMRGPCPALNTLANHGYLPRNGVATPTQIIQAVQEGFNMDSGSSRLAAYAGLLVGGNVLTDLMSIGGKSPLTGPDPPKPAIVGGLNKHGVFEGDASLTRSDDFFGDNHSFNQTLFDQLVEFSNLCGDGFYTLAVAAELRYALFQQSLATNPHFDFTAPRFNTAYAEAAFPFTFFVDRRSSTRALSMDNATLFFKDNRFPVQPAGFQGSSGVYAVHPVPSGKNMGGVNTFVADEDQVHDCQLYKSTVATRIVREMYPQLQGVLKRNLIINLGYLYDAVDPSHTKCVEEFPYGRL